MNRRSLIKLIAWFLSGCFVSIAIAACSPRQLGGAAADTPLVVAVQPWIGFQGHYIAQAQDLFTPEGISVEEELFQVATDTNTALAAGRVDLAWIGGPDLLTLVSQAPSLKIIMVSDYSDGADGVIGRGIASPEDMRGKRVAREDAPYAIIFLGEYLKQGGLTEDDVEVLPLSASDAVAAIAAGQVDAATTYEPWLSAATADGETEILFTTKDTNVVPIVLATRAEVIESRREDILAYLRAIDAALEFAAANPEAAAEISAQNLGVAPDEIPEQLAGIKPFDIEGNRAEPFNPDSSLYLLTSLESASETLFDLGKISAPVDATSLIDDSLIKELTD